VRAEQAEHVDALAVDVAGHVFERHRGLAAGGVHPPRRRLLRVDHAGLLVEHAGVGANARLRVAHADLGEPVGLDVAVLAAVTLLLREEAREHVATVLVELGAHVEEPARLHADAERLEHLLRGRSGDDELALVVAERRIDEAGDVPLHVRHLLDGFGGHRLLQLLFRLQRRRRRRGNGDRQRRRLLDSVHVLSRPS